MFFLVNNLAKGSFGEIHTYYSEIMSACLWATTVNQFFLMGTFTWHCTFSEKYFPAQEKSGIFFFLISSQLLYFKDIKDTKRSKYIVTSTPPFYPFYPHNSSFPIWKLFTSL